jgi:prepilin-type N-terminal cleavage/methylation domain-containing protein
MVSNSEGFTLIEVVVALLLIAFGVTASVPMFVAAAKDNAVSADLGWLGAAAVERMEVMRSLYYEELVPGGSLDTDVAGYFDPTHPDALIRWQVVQDANPSTVTLIVRAVARRQVVGEVKQVTMLSVRGR